MNKTAKRSEQKDMWISAGFEGVPNGRGGWTPEPIFIVVRSKVYPGKEHYGDIGENVATFKTRAEAEAYLRRALRKESK